MCSFIETHFLTNENPYGRSLSLRRHTYRAVCHPHKFDSQYCVPSRCHKEVTNTNKTLTLTLNPLTTTQFLKPLYNAITVMPVSQFNFTYLPFNNIDNNEIDFAHNTNNNVHHNKTNDDPLINEDSYDHSELGNADADCNFLVNNRRTICAYYNERFLMSHINTQTHSHYYKKKT